MAAVELTVNEDAAIDADGPDAGSKEPQRSDLQVVARVAAVLRLFGPNQHVIRPAEAEESLGLRRTTAYRYLNSLEQHGFLRRIDLLDGVGFELGPLVDQLGSLSSTRGRIIEASTTVMEDLVREVKQTVVLSIWNGEGPVVVKAAEDDSQMVHVSVRLGSVLSPTSAQGLALLAGQREGHRLDRLRSTLDPASLATIESGAQMLSRAGIVSSESVVLGVRSIAVPVLGEGDRTEAALAIVGTHGGVSDDLGAPAARALIRAGRVLSDLVRGNPPLDEHHS